MGSNCRLSCLDGIVVVIGSWIVSLWMSSGGVSQMCCCTPFQRWWCRCGAVVVSSACKCKVNLCHAGVLHYGGPKEGVLETSYHSVCPYDAAS